MNFEDASLIELASEVTRGEVIDDTVLEAMIEAAFETSNNPVSGPFGIAIERQELGQEIRQPVRIEGRYIPSPDVTPGEIQFQAHNAGFANSHQVDLLWRGELIARSSIANSVIEEVGGGFTLLDLDREIISDLGSLPAGAALSAARRSRFLARLKDGAEQPGIIDETYLDQLLDESGAANVDELLQRGGTTNLARLRLRFSQPQGAGAPVPIRLSATVAVLIRDTPIGLASLLAESRTIRTALTEDRSALPPEAQLPRRTPILILWVVPTEFLEDPDWPGASPAARRTNATALLREQGIAIATT